MPTLFISATPIGNLGDASPRLKQVLADCPVVLCEDTRVTLKLYGAFGLPVPTLLSCHQYNEKGRAAQIIERMLSESIDVCLVTDAGTPCISDPGYAVAAAAIERGIPVTPVAGPSAVTAALSVSGFPVDSYAFWGFLPREGKARREAFDTLRAQATRFAVVYESPFRVKDLMKDVDAYLPGARCALGCDLTKLHETLLYGDAAELRAALDANPKAEKGEYVLVIDLRAVERPAPPLSVSVRALLLEAVLDGEALRDAARRLSTQEGIKRNEVYRAMLEIDAFLEAKEGDGE